MLLDENGPSCERQDLVVGQHEPLAVFDRDRHAAQAERLARERNLPRISMGHVLPRGYQLVHAAWTEGQADHRAGTALVSGRRIHIMIDCGADWLRAAEGVAPDAIVITGPPARCMRRPPSGGRSPGGSGAISTCFSSPVS
jgi:hypothetical protein